MSKREIDNPKARSAHLVKDESGVALILALIMLLVMSVIATTVSFNSNNDFQAMSNYKQGQEAFLAAENCIQEGRNRFEIVGLEYMYLLEQNRSTTSLSEQSSQLLVLNNQLENGARCRSGPRGLNSALEGPGRIIEIPKTPIKTMQRSLKNTSMTTGASSGAGLIPVSFVVTGKDQRDKDLDDINDAINTGTEIAVGFEVFMPGSPWGY